MDKIETNVLGHYFGTDTFDIKTIFYHLDIGISIKELEDHEYDLEQFQQLLGKVVFEKLKEYTANVVLKHSEEINE